MAWAGGGPGRGLRPADRPVDTPRQQHRAVVPDAAQRPGLALHGGTWPRGAARGAGASRAQGKRKCLLGNPDPRLKSTAPVDADAAKGAVLIRVKGRAGGRYARQGAGRDIRSAGQHGLAQRLSAGLHETR